VAWRSLGLLADPRTILRRLLAPSGYGELARRRRRLWALRGDAVTCPCCDGSFSAFPDGVCPRCGAHPRHRVLLPYLRTRTGLLAEPLDVLHFAPEYVVRRWLAGRPNLRYVTADLAMRDVDVRCDLRALPFPAGSFDLALCSHVLEHVDDDRTALGELRRVVRPAGVVLLMMPVAWDRPRTREDPALHSPEQRRRQYHAPDHVRLYGRDVTDRLREAGFAVVVERYARELGPRLGARWGLDPDDLIFRCAPADA
jgi:SAM-dependent methyltransferase